MILQALYNYYLRRQEDLPPEGFGQKEIPFLIVLDQEGKFLDLQDTRTPSGKQLVARSFRVPKELERPGKNSWQKANILWDHFGYVLGHPKSENQSAKEMAAKQHRTFLKGVEDLFALYPKDREIRAVHSFLSSRQQKSVFDHPLWEECKKIPGCNLSFRLTDDLRLVCENDNVRTYVSGLDQAEPDVDDSPEVQEMDAVCLITGERGKIARLHPRTPIPGAKSNAKIVSFQKNMGFDSFGKEQSFNAPTSRKAAFAYTTALNHLLAKGSRQKLRVADSTAVFWSERQTPLEDLFADLFEEPAKDYPDRLASAVRDLYSAPATGAPPLEENYTPFFVLGLAPNAARIAVRFWHAGTVGETARQIKRHFDDCSVVHGPNQPEYLSLFRLLVSTATQGKGENIAPNLGGDFMKAILAGTPYPLNLLAAAIRRCRAEREISYPRAALIKGILAREARYYQKTEKEVGMGLNPSNTNVGYRLGRLFAVLEKTQEEANPGINATIRDRFYGAASSTPVTAFPHLMKLKNHHLAKLENRGRAVNLEKAIGEIVCGIEDFPAHLSLHDQGRFAVGYYHQRQDFFKKHEPTNENS